MKNFLTVVLLLTTIACIPLHAQSNEEDAIKQVVSSAYIDGIQNNGGADKIRAGFHPTFTMLRFTDNDVKPYPIEEWIAAIEKRKKDGAPAASPATGKFINISITGTAAVVQLELYRNDKKTFTDYLVLYKFTEGWKIVTKAYYRHP